MKRPDIKKPCETCCGTGEHMTDAGHFPCRVCHGEKEVYNYLTSEQWPYEMLDSDPVWKRPVFGGAWALFTYWGLFPCERADSVIARAGQPKPDDEWRPE